MTERQYTRYAKDDPDRIEVEPLREAFLRSGMTLAELARVLGWMQPVKPDTNRVARALGMRAKPGENAYRTTSYERAVEIVRALGLDPVDVGV